MQSSQPGQWLLSVMRTPVALPPSPAWSKAMQQRRRFEQLLFLSERLDQEASRMRAQADKLPHGPERESLLRSAHHAETSAHVDEWLASPGLKAPQ
jgi:hypothetical protein